MRTARQIRTAVLLVVLIGAAAWLVRSVVGLSQSANVYGNKVIKAEWSTSRPSALYQRQLLANQDDWGRSTMISVAIVAAVLLLLFVNAFLHDPRRTESETGGRDFPAGPAKE